MKLITAQMISAFSEEKRRLFEGVLPELVKRLIIASCSNIKNIRIPGNDDIWAPGFDGVVETSEQVRYVCEGKSVWEFGNSNQTLEKLNSDYDKRTKNSQGINKKETEFYLVTPKIWAYQTSITNWENNHSSDWKSVHVYDAVVISDWLNSQPSVVIWLLRKLGSDQNIDFCDLNSAWEKFSLKTNPRFSSSLFIGSREKEKNNFYNSLEKNIIKVKSDTRVDSYGFCLCSLIQNPDFENTVVVNNYITYKELSDISDNNIFLLNFKLENDFIADTKTIACYNKEDITVNADVNLNPLSKTVFDAAMKDMKLPKNQLYNIYHNTHGNLLSLIRRIPGNTSETSPHWVKQENINLIAPIVLLYNYNIENDYDKKIISYIANEKYDNVEQEYNKLLKLEDSPIKRVQNRILIINFEEAWITLNMNVNDSVFERFVNVIEGILNFVNNTENTEYEIKNSGLLSHLNRLFLDCVYFSQVSENKEKMDTAVEKIINKIGNCRKAYENISLLAEASPEVTLKYFNNDLCNKDSNILKAFNDEYDINGYCCILAALDELVLNENTNFAACNMLFDIYEKSTERKYIYKNSPKESLMKSLCLINGHTILTIEEKTKLIYYFLDKNQELFLPLAIELLFKRDFAFAVRDGMKKLPEIPIYELEVIKAINQIGYELFKRSVLEQNCKYIEKILRNFSCFYSDTLIRAAKLFKIEEYPLDGLISLNHCIHQCLYSIDEKEKYDYYYKALELWIECTSYKDKWQSYSWIFYDYYDFSIPQNIYNGETRWEDKERIRDEYRNKTFNDLLKKYSIEDICEIVKSSEDQKEWGFFYAKYFHKDDFLKITDKIKLCGKNNILYGILENSEIDDCIKYLNSISPQEQCNILSNISREDIICWLDNESKERAYWQHQIMRSYSVESFQKLIKYNPVGLIYYYAYWDNDSVENSADKVISILKAAISGLDINKRNCGISAILKRFDEAGYYTDEWALLCEEIYAKKLIDKYPDSTFRYYFLNPDKLYERLTDKTKDAFVERFLPFKLPECAFEKIGPFMNFIDILLYNQHEGDGVIPLLGNILGKAPCGNDGIFPHEFVREAMEKYNKKNLKHYVFIGKMNSLDARSVEDGTREKEISNKYFEQSKNFDIVINYPETSSLLIELGKFYSGESNKDELYAELGFNYL